MARPNKLIQFYLTNLCNSKCNTCNIWQNKVKEELSVNRVIDVIEQFPKADYVFGGGEFTLYSKRKELLEYCENNNINYTVLSNCIVPERLEELLGAGYIENLTISCDGLLHDKIRGVEGNLANIVHFIKFWKEELKNLKISYTLSAYNDFNIKEDMEFFKSLGFNKIYFCIAQDMDLLKVGEKSVQPSYESIQYLRDNYSDMLYDKDKQFLDDYILGKRKTCDSINSVHTIYSNGDVVLCQSKKSNVVLFNINDMPFKNIDEITKYTGLCDCNNECALVCQRRYDYEDRL